MSIKTMPAPAGQTEAHAVKKKSFKTWPLLGLCLAFSSMSHAADTRADPLLAAAKAAMGGAAWDKLDGLEVRGKIAGSGLTGEFSALADLRHVLLRQTGTLGPSSGSDGWDGKAAWSTDSSGEVRLEQGDLARATELGQAYRASYAFFWPERWPAQREYTGQKKADGVNYDVVKITPQDAEPFEIWLDTRTHRITRMADLTGDPLHTHVFSDFRVVNGVLLPFIDKDTIGLPAYDMVSTASSRTMASPMAPQFAPPPAPVEPDPFPPGVDHVSLPFTLANNHIFLKAAINGGAPVTFMFDNGATDALDSNHLQRLGLQFEGGIAGSGFGTQINTQQVGKVQALDIAGFKLSNQVFWTYDDAVLDRVEGVESYGLLGYEVARQAVITIDYAHKQMTLTRPDAFKPPKDAVAVPFTFDEHFSMVDATVDGIAGQFVIDTGARSALALLRPFSAAHQFKTRYNASINAITGFGLGGPSRALLMRPDELRIGQVLIKQPVGSIITDEGGAADLPRMAGNIGGDLLRRFTFTLDYPHQTLYFQPNAQLATPDVFDRSGLWVMHDTDGSVLISEVTPGSGGDKAGLKAGDHLLSVQGDAVEDFALTDLRDQFKAPNGTALKLVITRAGRPQEVTLILNDQI